MARIWSSGFELNSLAANVDIGAIVGDSATIQTTTVRNGTYALRVNSLNSATRKGVQYQFQSANSTGPFFFRMAARIDTLPSLEMRIWDILDTGGTNRVRVTLDGSGILRLYDEDGLIGAAASAIPTTTWMVLEIQFDASTSAGSHTVTLRKDGTAIVTATNRNIGTGVAIFRFGGNIGTEANTAGDFYFDDLAINDGSGSFQNSWPGLGGLHRLRPNAAGDNNQLGGAASTNYQAVDEVTPDDATTTISTVSDSVGEIDDYNVDATSSGISSTDTINTVQVGVRYAGGGASSNDTIVLRVKAAASGTVEESAGITPSSTSYVTNANSAPRNYALTLYDLPGASTTAWTKADLDTAQIGYRKSADSTNGVVVSAVWLLVDASHALVSTLSDNFDDNSLSSIWTDAGAANTNETSSRMEITTDATSPGAYYSIYSANLYSLSESSVYVELVSAGNQSLASLDAGFQIEKADGTGDDAATFFVEANTLYMRSRKATSNSDTSTAYSSTDHRWLRIRESAGTVYLDTAPDGTTWTNRRSFSNPFTDKTSLRVTLFAGTWGSEASGSLVVYDNLNVAPAGGGGTIRRYTLTTLGVG